MSAGAIASAATTVQPDLPAPEPGSARYFALLYCPAPQRAPVRTLMALADEIGAGSSRALDHALAHLRLEWWRQEALRNARAAAEHPWLRHLPTAPQLDLAALIGGAATDLATPGVHALHQALYLSIAQCLGIDRQPTVENALRELAQLALLEPRQPILPVALQPALTPLLVWTTVAHRQRTRDALTPAAQPSALHGLADNLAAWQSARRALRGRWQLPNNG